MTRMRVEDKSNDKGYFTNMPRLILVMSRTPHDFAFYQVVKEIAGESGECYVGTEDLAKLSKMSMGQVSKSRKYWIEMGFMEGEVRRDPNCAQKVFHLRILDVWAQNTTWCLEHAKISSRIAFIESLHTVKASKPSPGEAKPSPGETKKNKKKNRRSPSADAPGAASEEDGIPAVIGSVPDEWYVDTTDASRFPVPAPVQYIDSTDPSRLARRSSR